MNLNASVEARNNEQFRTNKKSSSATNTCQHPVEVRRATGGATGAALNRLEYSNIQ